MVAPGGCRSWAEKARFEDTSLGDIGQNGPTPAGGRNRTALAADLKEEKLSGAGDDPVVVGLHDALTAPGNQMNEVQRPNCPADGAFDIGHEEGLPASACLVERECDASRLHHGRSKGGSFVQLPPETSSGDLLRRPSGDPPETRSKVDSPVQLWRSVADRQTCRFLATSFPDALT